MLTLKRILANWLTLFTASASGMLVGTSWSILLFLLAGVFLAWSQILQMEEK